MKKGKLTVFILCLALLLTGATAAGAEENGQNIIRVSGEGVINVAPDRAELLLTVITEDADAGKAQAANADKSNRVIEALLQKDIAREDIQTQNYNLSPKYSSPPELTPIRADQKAESYTREIVGYTVQHRLRVKVKDIGRVGELMELAVENGANRISNVSFSVSDSLEYKKKALRAAVTDARAKAEVLAAALGKELAGIKSAGGSWSGSNPGPVYYREMAAADNAAGSLPVSPGKAQIRANATIEFLIR